MITILIDENTDEGRELMQEIHKRPHSAHRVQNMERNSISDEYLTAEEWRDNCKKNISELFRRHEESTL